jgi:hypothetical protein
MKIKINRKKRGTHRTRHARQCKRNKNRRTRSQRGGTTKEELLKEILAQYKGSIIPIPSYFITDDTFTKFLFLYGELELQRVVCGDYSEEAIRLHETQYLTKIKQKLETKPDPKTQFLNDLFLTPKFINSWTDFVISLKNSVDARYSADFKQRMDALKEDQLKPQLNKGLISPPSRPAATARPAARPSSAARPLGSEVGTRQVAPPGWELNGNVWQDGKGGVFSRRVF